MTSHADRLRTACIVLLAAMVTASTAEAQESGVALYYPDFQAIRALFDPLGQTNLPQGPEQKEIVAAWQAISPRGRDLLLRESSLAVVVLDNRGAWLYRTASIPRLQILPSEADGPRPGDFQNLSSLLDYRWFQTLRQFYGSLLFSQGGPEIGQRVGPLLTEVNQMDGLPDTQKDWFRGLIGVELQGLESTSRVALLSDPEHAGEFAEALAAADARRNVWQNQIGVYLSGGQPSDTLNIAAMPQAPAEDHPWWMATQSPSDVQNIDGRNVFIWQVPEGFLYAAPKDDGSPIPMVHMEATNRPLGEYLKSQGVRTFLTTPGTVDVFEVEGEG